MKNIATSRSTRAAYQTEYQLCLFFNSVSSSAQHIQKQDACGGWAATIRSLQNSVIFNATSVHAKRTLSLPLVDDVEILKTR
jgi:hypothetical protein